MDASPNVGKKLLNIVEASQRSMVFNALNQNVYSAPLEITQMRESKSKAELSWMPECSHYFFFELCLEMRGELISIQDRYMQYLLKKKVSPSQNVIGTKRRENTGTTVGLK